MWSSFYTDKNSAGDFENDEIICSGLRDSPDDLLHQGANYIYQLIITDVKLMFNYEVKLIIWVLVVFSHDRYLDVFGFDFFYYRESDNDDDYSNDDTNDVNLQRWWWK